MKVINTPDAPKAIGPYSQAVIANGLLFTSGQIAINPKTNQIEATAIEEQTKQVMENLKALLAASNASFDKVVKTTIFLKDMNTFGTVNEIYGSYFANHKPARSTVEVARLPKDVLIEIELIAKID
ncbi:MAG TPA: RidA family protein [Bacilli bacterium]|jgi:2-iminobutanoate/2-iminopropanoate deaminase|nr:RidA family protein [Acholeplasmataceae bacterium]OQB65128.1 MAG: Enamine/imine deaminase [Tenericutes bacterium ADurb.Bin140]HOE77195.1 RidA family protein [Bacilli bacterium]HON63311.1 RidA family protein [Bacilli bacterium]HOR95371.1 RidA family protein [Bacilli bacterium]